MKVLVTGGAGFIGSHLVDRLIQEGHEVVVVDNLSTGKRRNLNRAARFFKLDIQSWRLERVFRNERPNVIMHLAAQMDVRKSVADPIFDAQINVLGMLNVLQQAVRHGVRKMVFSSSGGAIYGEQEIYPAPESHVMRPLSPYGISKLCGEQYLSYYQRVSGLQMVNLRYSNVYGPRQDPHGLSGAIAVFGGALIAGRPVTIYGDGTAVRDYVYVDDVVDAFICAARLPSEAMGTYNIGSGEQTTVNEVYRRVAAAVGVSSPPRYAAARTGEVHAIALDSTEAREDLGWKPSIKLVDGIQRTVHWLRGALETVPPALVDA